LAKYKEIQKIILIFLKFKNSLRSGHCYYSTYVPKNLATPLLLKEFREILYLFICYVTMYLKMTDVIKEQKCGKSPGANNIPAEIIKAWGIFLAEDI